MKKIFALTLLLVLGFSACVTKPAELIISDITHEAAKESYLPGTAVTELKSFADGSASYDGAVFCNGLNESLLNSGYPNALVAAHDGAMFVYRNFPRDMSVHAREYDRKPNVLLPAEVYSLTDGTTPKREIALQAPAGAYAIAEGICVNADGISLLLISADSMKDGLLDLATYKRSVVRYGFDGKLLEEQTAHLPLNFMPLSLLRADGGTFLLVEDSLRPEEERGMTEAEKAVFTIRQEAYRRLCVLDAVSGSFMPAERAGMENAALLSAMPHPGGRILCVDFVIRPDTGARAVQVSVWNPADNTSEALTYAHIAVSDHIEHQMAYDAAANTLYFYQNDELLAWKLDSAAPITRLRKVDKVGLFDRFCAADGYLYHVPKNVEIERLSNITLPDNVPITASNAGSIAYSVNTNTMLSILANAYHSEYWDNVYYDIAALHYFDEYAAL